MMNLSLNPTYKCNLRCDFCYLGDKLSDPSYISLNDIETKLEEVSGRYGGIGQIDIYGGEISLLSFAYQTKMIDICKKYTKQINLITNLVEISPIFFDTSLNIAVSYDFEARFGHQNVFENMQILLRPFTILMLASEKVIQMDPKYIIDKLNTLYFLEAFEIKPYSTNQYNQQNVSFEDFEKFVKGFLNLDKEMRFDFVNKESIEASLSKEYNSFSSDHIYITPNNKYGVLEFDENDNEFFLELDNLNEYEDWVKKEKNTVSKNSYCSKCEYLGHCMTEHYRDVKDISKSCNGFKKLLDWYKNERLEV